MAQFIIYAMRHGEKNGDTLTELGERQVRSALEAHVPVKELDAVYSSEMHRTAQTAAIAVELSGNHIETAKVRRGFGYQWVDDQIDDGLPTLRDQYGQALKKFGHPTPFQLLQHCSVAWALRGRFIAEMFACCVEGQTTILICSHDGVVGSAASGDALHQQLDPVDIIRYTIDNDGDDGFRIVESVLLRCPLVE